MYRKGERLARRQTYSRQTRQLSNGRKVSRKMASMGKGKGKWADR